MKKRFDFATVFVLMALVAAVATLVTYLKVKEQFNNNLIVTNRTERENAKYLDAKNYIERYYIGAWDEERLLNGAVEGLVDSLGDELSCYLDAVGYQNYTRDTANDRFGIGIGLRKAPDSANALVTTVYPASPAEEAGILPYDTVIAVNGVTLAESGYLPAVAAISGEENTKVELTLRRASDGREYSVSPYRRLVQREDIRSEILADDIGLVRVYSFAPETEVFFSDAVNSLVRANVRGIIFDLRCNPGGTYETLRSMLDLLLGEGVFLTVRGKSGNDTVFNSDLSEIDTPMVVLTDRNTCNVAEYFAAALRDFGKARIVGEQTAGLGLIYQALSLTDGSGLILPMSELYTPRGISLNGTGLRPDVEVTVSDDERLNGYDDVQMVKAIEVLKQLIVDTQPPLAAEAQQENTEESGE